MNVITELDNKRTLYRNVLNVVIQTTRLILMHLIWLKLLIAKQEEMDQKKVLCWVYFYSLFHPSYFSWKNFVGEIIISPLYLTIDLADFYTFYLCL